VRRQFELSNDLAAGLAGEHDAMLRALEERLAARVYLRGNLLTLDGEPAALETGARVIAELGTLAPSGHPLDEATLSAVIGVLNADSQPAAVLDDVVWRHRAMRVAPRTVGQKRYVDSIRENTITFGIGPAGTGKTFLAVALAAAALSRKEVNRIILTRPAVEAGEALGFLPGDLRDKILPYLRPLYDALQDMLEPEEVARLTAKGVIEIAPLAYMRGRTLAHAFVVLDEAQNTTSEQMMMFLTRLGEDARMVITGDVTQIDLPRSKASGLLEARQILREVPGVDFHAFSSADVVRHPLVRRIIDAYARHRASERA